MKRLLLILLCFPMIGFGQINYYEDEGISFTYPSTYLLDSATPTPIPQMQLKHKDPSYFGNFMIDRYSLSDLGGSGNETLKGIGDGIIKLLETQFNSINVKFGLISKEVEIISSKEIYVIKNSLTFLLESYYNVLCIYKKDDKIFTITLTAGSEEESFIYLSDMKMILKSVVLK